MASVLKNSGASPQFTWRELWGHGWFAIRQSWVASRPLMAGLVGGEVLRALGPALFALAVGLLIREAKFVFEGVPEHQSTLGMVLAAIVVLMLMDILAEIGRRYATSRLTDEVRLRLSVDIARHLSSIDLAFFEDPESQNVVERAGRQPGRDLVAFVTTIISIITQGLQTATLAGVLIYIEPVFTPIVVLVSLPLLIFRWHMAKLTYATERQQATIRRWSSYYLSAVTSRGFVPTVKLYELAPVLIRQFKKYLGQIIGVNRRLYRKQAIGEAAASVAVTLAASGLIVWVGYRAISGELSIQLFGTFVVAIMRMKGSVQDFVTAVAGSLEKVLFISNLGELLRHESSIKGGSNEPARLTGAIELRDVHFSYPGTSSPVIKGVTMRLQAGQTVALLGPNGCGKTTLTRLIARLYEIDRGSILFDGHDIRQLSLPYLHGHIAYVTQSPVRFEATVHENIAYGNWERLADAPDEVRQIAEEANIANMIRALPDGYETFIGRRFGAFDLSGGQWQKLALARALARNAPILILDEPTASMDVHSEAEMYQGFKKLAAGTTTLLISHRFSTVAMADFIYVMDDGQIVDQGSHEQLLQRGGIYSAMYELHHRVFNRVGAEADQA